MYQGNQTPKTDFKPPNPCLLASLLVNEGEIFGPSLLPQPSYPREEAFESLPLHLHINLAFTAH
jgi:hypothetical protein